MSTQLLNWGLLATGKIAAKFAKGVAASKTGRVVAVGSRTQKGADAFAKEHGIARAHGSYEALLADPEVQAVYISTPHPWHCEWTVKAAQAGKHILCEKPMGMHAAEVDQMFAAARRHGVFAMEAFMYRCLPQTARVSEIVGSGVLGDVGLVQATFGFHMPFDAKSRLWNNQLGGGGILDVGCYPVSFARLVAGAAEGQGAHFANPIEVSGSGATHPQTGVDVWAAATLKFSCGMVAQLATSVGLQQENTARIYGTKGWLHVLEPWVPSRNEGRAARLRLYVAGAEPEDIVIPYQVGEYTLEADAVAAAIAGGKREAAQMSWADSLGNAAVLDKWLACVGVKYGRA